MAEAIVRRYNRMTGTQVETAAVQHAVGEEAKDSINFVSQGGALLHIVHEASLNGAMEVRKMDARREQTVLFRLQPGEHTIYLAGQDMIFAIHRLP